MSKKKHRKFDGVLELIDAELEWWQRNAEDAPATARRMMAEFEDAARIIREVQERECPRG